MTERTVSKVPSSARETQVAGSFRSKVRSIFDELRVVAGGVPESAWSKEDRERMAKGELPKGHPEHPNV